MDKWVLQLRTEQSGGQTTSATAMTLDQRNIKELEKRIEYIELEKEILKKLPHS